MEMTILNVIEMKNTQENSRKQRKKNAIEYRNRSEANVKNFV